MVGIKKRKPDYYYQQSAVLPYRIRNGMVEVLLITSLKKENWIIPKGIVEPGISPADSAEKEAFEEAGISGNTEPAVFDVYEVEKWGGRCRIEVYLMVPEKVLNTWPEKLLRKRKWFEIKEAAKRVQNEQLRRIILHLRRHVGKPS